VLQFGLFARALPTERLATLMARLGALMGDDRVGAPALVDSYRPGAFAMAKFEPQASQQAKGAPNPESRPPNPAVRSALRRFRAPIPARVTLAHGRPVRLTTDRRGFSGGAVEWCDGPWRSSGDWWLAAPLAPLAPRGPRAPWNCDEWDVTLSDGTSYRISRVDIAEREVAARRAGASRDQLIKDAWFVNGILD